MPTAALRRRAAAAVLLLAALAVPAAAAVAADPADPAAGLLSEALRASLDQGLPPEAQVSVTLTMPAPGPLQNLRDVTYDRRTGHVAAVATSGGRTVELKARAEIVLEVPVPVRRLARGEVIGPADLELVPMPLDQVADTVVINRADLVGKATRRQVPPGRPIQASAVGVPIVVVRNAAVRLIYEDGALYLSARGRALQDGGIGESVRVMNAASSLVVTGVITGPQTVSVSGPDALVSPPPSRGGQP